MVVLAVAPDSKYSLGLSVRSKSSLSRVASPSAQPAGPGAARPSGPGGAGVVPTQRSKAEPVPWPWAGPCHRQFVMPPRHVRSVAPRAEPGMRGGQPRRLRAAMRWSVAFALVHAARFTLPLGTNDSTSIFFCITHKRYLCSNRITRARVRVSRTSTIRTTGLTISYS